LETKQQWKKTMGKETEPLWAYTDGYQHHQDEEKIRWEEEAKGKVLQL
jgi:hypothetical protein